MGRGAILKLDVALTAQLPRTVLPMWARNSLKRRKYSGYQEIPQAPFDEGETSGVDCRGCEIV